MRGIRRRLTRPAHRRRPLGNVFRLVVVDTLNERMQRTVRSGVRIRKCLDRLVKLLQKLLEDRFLRVQRRILACGNRPRWPWGGKGADKAHFARVLERLSREPLPASANETHHMK